MNKQKNQTALILIIIAIVALGIGWLVVANTMLSDREISFPAGAGDSLTEDDLEYVPFNPEVLAAKTFTGPRHTSSVEYRYNTAGILVREIWNNGMIVDYEFYDNGNPRSEHTYNSEHDIAFLAYREDGTMERLTEYTYYTDGRLASTSITEYDEHENMVVYSDVDADGDYSYTIRYTNSYDADGRITRQETTRDDGTLLHVDSWHYQEDGTWALESVEYNGDPDDNPVWRHELFCYDADGKQLSTDIFISDMYPSQDYILYTYDEHDDLVRQEWVMHPLNNDDYTSYIVEYVYTYENGQLIRKETFSSEKSSYEGTVTETPPTSTVVETWEYNDNGMVVVHNDGNITCTYTYQPLDQVLAS